MKFLPRILSAALLAAPCSLVLAQSTAPVAAPMATSPMPAMEPAFSEAQILETFGWFVGKRLGLTELGFTPEQTASIIKGLKLAGDGSDAPYELEQIGPLMDQYLQGKQQEYMAKAAEIAAAESAAFFAKVAAEEPNLVTLPSGLRYVITELGTGPKPMSTDTVQVHYTGKLSDGTVFDSSVEGGQPAEFQVDGVIPGWTEGLQLLPTGSKAKFYVPAELAYGDQGAGQIPPNATLVFDIELLAIVPAAAPAMTAPMATPMAP